MSSSITLGITLTSGGAILIVIWRGLGDPESVNIVLCCIGASAGGGELKKIEFPFLALWPLGLLGGGGVFRTIDTGAMFLKGDDSACLAANPRLSPFLPKGEGGGGGGLRKSFTS